MLLTSKTNITSPNEVLAAVQAALAANGWLTVASAYEGTGRRVHLSKGGVYVHLRSALNELGVFTDTYGNFSGLGLTVGTGYAGGADWRQQPGVPVERRYLAAQAVCAAFNGAANLWVIADSLDNTVIVLEAPTGVFQQLAFGPSLRKEAPFTGGMYLWGTQRGSGLQYLAANKTPLAQDYAFFVRADVDAFTGKWLGAGFSDQAAVGYTGKNAATSAQETYAVPTYQKLLARTVSYDNGQPVLLPTRIFAQRDSGSWCQLGEVPLVYATNKVKVANGQGAGSPLQLGDEAYILFPGIAIKLNDEPAAAARAAGEAAPVRGARSQLEGKVLISPASIDAGFIGSDTAYPLTLWNTNPTETAIGAGVSIQDFYGVQLQGGLAFSIEPGRAIQRMLTVRATGKPMVNEQIAFAFEGMRSSTVNLTGNRLVLFTLSPDWSAAVREAVSYQSSLVESYAGKEQRASLVSKPGRTLSYTAKALSSTELARAEAAIYAGQAVAIGAPLWSQASRTTAATPAGSKAVSADTRLGDYAPGSFAVLTLGELAEVVEVAAVSPEGLTLVQATTTAFAKGAQLAPLLVARLEAEISSSHDTAAVAAYDIKLVEEV